MSMSTNGDSHNDEIEYPTAATVGSTYFPYPTLYPQQRDLIDTFLQSLQLIHERSGSPSSSTSTTTTTTTTNNNNNNTHNTTGCPVYLLESPTGTGKSLSLACSAMAWLRYMEQRDLQPPPAVRHSTATNHDGDDWIQNWVPPSERQESDRHEQMIQTATKARKSLQAALQHITTRQQQQQQQPSDRRRIRQRMVRAAVVEAQQEYQAATNQQKRRRQRQYVGPPRVAHHNDEFLLDLYHSDGDNDTPGDWNMDDDDDDNDLTTDRRSTAAVPLPIVAARRLLDGSALDGSQSQRPSTPQPTVGHVPAGSGVRKIIYTARTHSQLSQFVREVRRCGGGDQQKNTVRVVHLGGRNNLCTNPAVTKASHSHNHERAITEACLDLQKGLVLSTVPSDADHNNNNTTNKKRRPDEGGGHGCPMLEGREYTIPTLALHMQTEPTDIEEAVQMGQASRTCAYYASRAALVSAEIVVLPYSMLLSKATRESIGLSLQQSLVIVDEAHNVPEALRSIHSCSLSLPIIETALQQLLWYTQKYSDRMAGRNLFYLGQLRKILLSFQKHLNTTPSPNGVGATGTTSSHFNSRANNQTTKNSGMMTATELLIDRKLDNINLYRVLRFLQHSRLSQKLLGYTNYKNKLEAKNDTDNTNSNGLSKHVSAMSVVETFLEKLAFHGSDGKVAVDRPKQNASKNNNDSDDDNDRIRSKQLQYPSYRYVLLHPAAFFENVLQEAYALALVGGTLRPFVHVVAELLGDRASTTVLNDAAKADAMASTPPVPTTTGAPSEPVVSNTFISNNFTAFTCDHVVPSSNVLLQCMAHGPMNHILDFRFQSRTSKSVCDELGRTLLQISGSVPNGVVVFLPSYSYESFLVQHWKKSGMWSTLQAIKAIHREPKSSQYIEASLQSYSRDAVQGSNGAILFSVIGGKMSEGINFSDDMARCVIIVGLPYPDITDPVLIEKMAALDNLPTDQAITGKSYYQNLCLRAVGQSVGRAIRHANDYAAIVLLDQRYCSDSRVWSGLPNWLKKGCKNTTWHDDIPFTKRLNEMKEFFDSKNSNTSN